MFHYMHMVINIGSNITWRTVYSDGESVNFLV